MHGAPSVTYPVGRSFWHGAFVAGTVVLGAVALGFWAAHAAVGPALLLSGIAVLLVGAATAALGWLRSPDGMLSWDGEGWQWTAGTAASGTIETVLDLQFLVLVRWRGAGRHAWLCLERRSAPARWMDMRRAVYSRARPDALPGT